LTRGSGPTLEGDISIHPPGEVTPRLFPIDLRPLLGSNGKYGLKKKHREREIVGHDDDAPPFGKGRAGKLLSLPREQGTNKTAERYSTAAGHVITRPGRQRTRV
jgi:hypothetical protein